MHVAFDSPHSLTKELLREAFMYAFDRCSVVYGLTPIEKSDALRFNKKIGFVEVYRSEFFVLQEMRREKCRWIRDKDHGRNVSSSTATTDANNGVRSEESAVTV